MRRTSFAFALIALAALAAPARAADAVAKSPWDGFGEGSWVLQKTTTKNVKGDEKSETVAETRTTLKKITDKAYTLKLETKIGEEWIPQDLDLPRVAESGSERPADAKVEDLGKETIQVDGESLECKKQRTTAGGNTTVTWSHEKYGVVKSESKGADGETTLALTELKASLKIKGKDVECRVEKTTHKSAEAEMVATVWRTDAAIPTQTGYVRSESMIKIPGAGTTTEVMETMDFEKK